MTKTVVLLSGGLDSSANLAFAVERDSVVLALTARYGQRAQEREVAAARALCEYYQVPHAVVDLQWLGALGGSALTDVTAAMPALATSELDNREVTEASAKQVWVPNRNGVLLNVAAAYAETLGALRIAVGFNREEAATFPDNTQAYLEALTAAFYYSTANHARVFSYTVAMDKKEIVAALRGLSRSFPFQLLWSCYEASEKPCGECESCRRLARALV